MIEEEEKEYDIECNKCHKKFKAKLTESIYLKRKELIFLCGKCAWKSIQSGEF